MCLTKVRNTDISLTANNVPLNDLSTGADSVVTNYSIPHSQTWAQSQEANKRSGMCSVCFATRQIHVNDGTIHKHGPRNNPCTGSDQLPVSESVQPQQSRQPLQSNTTACSPSLLSLTVNSVDHHTATKPILQHGRIRHQIQNKPILKRIDKGARPAVQLANKTHPERVVKSVNGSELG